MSRPIAFIDTETTGLNPSIHVVWEWAIILDGVEHHGQVYLHDHEITGATPEALDVGQWWDRYVHATAEPKKKAAERIAQLLEGATLVGAQPHFDARFLTDLLGVPADEAPWHHRFLDVESMAAGVLGNAAPISLSDTALALDIPLDGRPRHTALEDARLARDVHAAALGRRSSTLKLRPEGRCPCGHRWDEHGRGGCAAHDEAAMGGCVCFEPNPVEVPA